MFTSKPICIILIRQLALGGLEKSAFLLQKQLENEFDVHLLSIFPNAPSSSISIFSRCQPYVLLNDSKTHLGLLNISRIIYSLLAFIKSIHSLHGASHARYFLISLGVKENVIALLSVIIAKTIFSFKLYSCVSERNHPAFKKFTPAVRFLRWSLYPFAFCIHVQTISAKNWLLKHNSRLNKKVFVIPNTCSLPKNIPPPPPPLDTSFFEVLLIGNKFYQKGFDLLCRHSAEINQCFKHLNSGSVDLRFHVFGGCLDGSKLANCIYANKSTELVIFHGPRSLDHIFSKRFGCFLLLSRYEGFPNVLLESITNNILPCVFDNDYGVDEIVGPSYPFMFSKPEPETIASLLAKIYCLCSSSREDVMNTLRNRLAVCSAENTACAWRSMISNLPQ